MTVKTTVSVSERRKATLADIRRFAAATRDWPEDVEVSLGEEAVTTGDTGGRAFSIDATYRHDPEAQEPEGAAESPLPAGGGWVPGKPPMQTHPAPYYPIGTRGPVQIGDVPPHLPGTPGQVWCTKADTTTRATNPDPRENVPMREH